MVRELEIVNDRFIDIMRGTQGVMGAWNFGSAAHDMSDEYSDVDIIFLIDGKSFEQLDCELPRLIAGVCDEVVLSWPEDFNSEAIKNYGFLLKFNNRVFQYDVFMLNSDLLDDFMCRLHYTDLKEQDVLFDINGNVGKLIDKALRGSLWKADIMMIIDTYWYHAHMTAKYIVRKDYFKLNNALRTMMDTHISLLLTAYDKITWGGSANKLHFVPEDMQRHLMRYYCTEDFAMNSANVQWSIEQFEADIFKVGTADQIEYGRKKAENVKAYWLSTMK